MKAFEQLHEDQKPMWKNLCKIKFGESEDTQMMLDTKSEQK